MQDGVGVIQGELGIPSRRLVRFSFFLLDAGLEQTPSFGGGKGCSNAQTTPLFQDEVGREGE